VAQRPPASTAWRRTASPRGAGSSGCGWRSAGSPRWRSARRIQAGWHGIERPDVAALGGAAATFAGAMLVASAAPAWRASRLDPVETLKDA
jgi:hypothetical protein